MTFSIIGRCEKTNMVGVAISSSSISVASRCPWVRAGVGAASTQNVTDPSLGNLMLDYLEKGLDVTEVINKIIKEEKNIEYRQLLLIDNKGNTSQHTGSKILGMSGFGGQNIVIDFEKERIIVVNSRDRHYNWKKIVLKKLKQK